jgi:hypothetical protein
MQLIKAPAPYHGGLTEIYQKNAHRFSFCTQVDENTVQEVTSAVKCREYFTEFLMTAHHGMPPTDGFIYGFNYNHVDTPFDVNNPLIAFTFDPNDSLGFKTTFLANLHKLHELEQLYKIQLTKIHSVDNDPYTVIISCDPFWFKKSIALNLYTQILKLLCLDFNNLFEATLLSSEEQFIVLVGVRNWNQFLRFLPELVECPTPFVDGFNEQRGIYPQHDSSGIIALNYLAKGRTTSNQLNEAFLKILKKTNSKRYKQTIHFVTKE